MKCVSAISELRSRLHVCIIVLAVILVAPVMVVADEEASDNSDEVDEVIEIGTLDDELVVLDESEDDQPADVDNMPTDSYKREPLLSREAIGDFVIGPGRFDVSLAPGQTRVVQMTVANRTGEGKIFTFETEDAQGSADPNRTVDLLGDKQGPYTLRDYISVPHWSFYLEHGQRALVPVTISLPPDAEPGGRYGSLLVSVTSKPTEERGAGTRSASAIISRLGTLFFITTPGDIEWNSALTGFSTRNSQRFFGSAPITFDITQENFGTVHTVPYGRVTITNILGEEIGRVNLDPWYVMPQAVRTRELVWNRDLVIGRYTATAQINRGYDDIVDEMSFSFYVIPWKLALMVFAILFFFFLGLRFFFSRFEFKRKT